MPKGVPKKAAPKANSQRATRLVSGASALAGSEPPSVGSALVALRRREGLSLDGLARRSGVSKSMLSQIERNRTNPTVAVVWRLGNALGVEVAELLRGGPTSQMQPIHLVSEARTPTMRGPDGKYELRILGPVELAGRFEWYELILQPGGMLKSEPHESGSREHLTVLSGAVIVKSADQSQLVSAEQTARYPADVTHAIVNDSEAQTVALLVVLHPG